MLKRIVPLVLIAATSTPVFADSLWGRVEKLENQMEAVTDLTQRMDVMQQENSNLRGKVEELNYQLDQLKQQQRELYLDIERRLGRSSGDAGEAPVALSKPKPAPAKKAAPAAKKPAQQSQPAGNSERDQYRRAYDLLITKRQYPESVDAFKQLLQDHPHGDYADNAQFWLGEAFYAMNDLDGAMQNFQALIDRFTESPKVPDAVYKVGHIHKVKGDTDKAKMVFEGLIQHYPDTPAAKLAAKKISQL